MRNDYKRLLAKAKYTNKCICRLLNLRYSGKNTAKVRRRLKRWGAINYNWSIKEANVIWEKYPEDNHE